MHQAETRPRSRALWARGGHFGASQVPDCTSVGPGGIDIDLLTGKDAVPSVIMEPERPAPAIRLDRHAGVRIAQRELPLTAASV